MPKNINGSNSSGGSIFSNIIVNLFEARLNSNANNFLVYNSSPLAPLFKIDGLNSIATFYCDVNVVGNASFTTVDNIAVTSSMISLAQDNTANDLIDIGFYGEYKTSGVVKYRGLVKNVNAGKWVLFKDITTPPSSIVTLAGSYRDDLDVNNLYWGGAGDNLVTLRSDVDSFPVELKTLTSGTYVPTFSVITGDVSSVNSLPFSSYNKIGKIIGLTLSVNFNINVDSGNYVIRASLPTGVAIDYNLSLVFEGIALTGTIDLFNSSNINIYISNSSAISSGTYRVKIIGDYLIS